MSGIGTFGSYRNPHSGQRITGKGKARVMQRSESLVFWQLGEFARSQRGTEKCKGQAEELLVFLLRSIR